MQRQAIVANCYLVSTKFNLAPLRKKDEPFYTELLNDSEAVFYERK